MLYSIFNSNKLMTYLFWSLTKTINFLTSSQSICYVVIQFCDSVWFFWVKQICSCFLGMFISVLPFEIQYSEWIVIPLTSLPLAHFCACPTPRHGFPSTFVKIFCVHWFGVRLWEVFGYWWNCWPSMFNVSFDNLLFNKF